MKIEFKNSVKEYTLGVELEVQLIDLDTLSLTSTSTEIIEALDGLDGKVKHELTMSNLEVVTGVCSSVGETYGDLIEKLNSVSAEADRFNTILCCAGTHPFSRWRDQEITQNPRYRRLLENLQFIARRFNIFGLHVHTGIRGAEKCIYVMNRMLYWLPHLLAVSANSPFWEGEDTGLKSYRTKVFESLPIAGLPFYFKDWSDYKRLVANYLRTGTIETIRELWWDVRPHPDFGTIEIRVCDIPSTMREVASLTALIQALVMKFGNDYEDRVPFKRPHSAVIRENKWRACRYGLGGEFLTPGGDGTVRVRDALDGLLRSVEAEVRDLGSGEFMASMHETLESGGGAERQLRVWRERGDLRDVVRDMVQRLRAEYSTGMR